MNSLNNALQCIDIILEKKVIDPVLLDIGKISSIADYFIIASGRSSRQVRGIAEHLQKRMKEKGFKVLGIEGERDGFWTLLDYGEIVVHLFFQPARKLYDLEGLWSEASRVNINEKIPKEETQ